MIWVFFLAGFAVWGVAFCFRVVLGWFLPASWNRWIDAAIGGLIKLAGRLFALGVVAAACYFVWLIATAPTP